MQDVPMERADAELWLSVAESVSHKIGHEFLGGLVHALRDKVSADLVFISAREGGEGRSVRAVWALEDGEPVDGFSYDLEGTPCSIVFGGQELLIPCDLAQAFPKEEGFQGYTGVPFYDDEGQVDGHLAILSREKIQECPITLPMARIFALRIAAERRRAKLESERDALQSELEAINRDLRRSYHAVHSANAFKTRLLSVMAHDLRNPLAVIMCQAELAETLCASSDPSAEKIGKAGAKASTSAERMGEMIQATLDRLKSESEGRAMKRGPAELGALLRLAVEANMRPAAEKSVLVSTKIPLDPHTKMNSELTISVDQVWLLEALDRLIDSAIRLSPSGSTVTVSWKRQDQEAWITVADAGAARGRDELDRAFDWPGAQAEGVADGEDGAAFGLSVVKEMALAHGGRVEAECANQGQGAALSIVLPLEGGEECR